MKDLVRLLKSINIRVVDGRASMDYADWEAVCRLLAAPAPATVATEAVAHCGNEECGWSGPAAECVKLKHGGAACCPECYDTTETDAVAQGGGVDAPWRMGVGAVSVPVEVIQAAIDALQIADHVAEPGHATDADYKAFADAEAGLRALLASPAPLVGVEYKRLREALENQIERTIAAQGFTDDETRKAMLTLYGEAAAPAIAKQSEGE